MSSFNNSIMIREDINRRLASAAQDLAYRAILDCAEVYGFDGQEAINRLGLSNVSVRREESRKPASKKEVVVKPAFPLPYNGEYNAECCEALRQNNGLYTQCQVAKKGTEMYCKSCQQLVAKSEAGIPEYGTIDQRQAVGPFEYVDPKGRRPVAYTKVMKKYKVSEEQVLAEAGKFNIKVLPEHFVSPASASKRGRPKKESLVAKEPKGAKGRPKKTKKVLEIEGDDEEDLFVSMVAAAAVPSAMSVSISSESENESIGAAKITKKVSSAEKEAAKAAKALKKQQEEEAKAAKALKKQQEEEAKALKKQQEEEAKAAKKQQEEEAKAAKALKKQQEEEAKAAKALKKQQEEEAKAAKAAPKAAKEEPKAEQQDSVKKFEWEGKKYLRSKLSGVIYDRELYDTSGEIVQIGRWNEAQQRIDFLKQEESEEEESSDSDEEEEEEEYEN